MKSQKKTVATDSEKKASNGSKKKDNPEKPVVKSASTNGIGEATVVEEPPDPLINPVWKMEKAFEKKLRNLKKRELKLSQLKEATENSGKELTTEQHDALTKMDEVKQQIVFVEEMIKLNGQQLSQYKKAFKQRERQQKLDQKRAASIGAGVPKPQIDSEEMSDKRGEKNQPKETDEGHPKVIGEEMKKAKEEEEAVMVDEMKKQPENKKEKEEHVKSGEAKESKNVEAKMGEQKSKGVPKSASDGNHTGGGCGAANKKDGNSNKENRNPCRAADGGGAQA